MPNSETRAYVRRELVALLKDPNTPRGQVSNLTSALYSFAVGTHTSLVQAAWAGRLFDACVKNADDRETAMLAQIDEAITNSDARPFYTIVEFSIAVGHRRVSYDTYDGLSELLRDVCKVLDGREENTPSVRATLSMKLSQLLCFSPSHEDEEAPTAEVVSIESRRRTEHADDDDAA